eukprot:NODE_4354_length_1182_cov_12.273843_g3845_i0.p1 GENE.NODE_4354_length_1182_cov_12.273843_g3845_i0~~NODE_4354_length_1182_cov_12.273843_g3845_i0.p1  ORF type:complete len:232 (-),score=6.80 NODE_4354_length_1182_cov_12.273843_g3845_i0:487-1134(-)
MNQCLISLLYVLAAALVITSPAVPIIFHISSSFETNESTPSYILGARDAAYMFTMMTAMDINFIVGSILTWYSCCLYFILFRIAQKRTIFAITLLFVISFIIYLVLDSIAFNLSNSKDSVINYMKKKNETETGCTERSEYCWGSVYVLLDKRKNSVRPGYTTGGVFLGIACLLLIIAYVLAWIKTRNEQGKDNSELVSVDSPSVHQNAHPNFSKY